MPVRAKPVAYYEETEELKDEKQIINVYDENGPDVQGVILNAFEKYLKIKQKKPISYTQVGDYKLPNLTIKDIDNKSLNKYGLLKLDYLKKNKKALYQQLLMTNELNNFLFSVGNEAQEMVEKLMEDYIKNDSRLSEKEEEIDNLTTDNNYLKFELTKWKNKFLKIIFIKNRLLRPKNKDKYKEFTIDLYTNNALDQETFGDIKNNYSKDKRKDDFER